jgi:hypothetical protein
MRVKLQQRETRIALRSIRTTIDPGYLLFHPTGYHASKIGQPMEQKQPINQIETGTKVSILLAEYNTLRAEIMQRGTVLVSVFGVGVAALAVLIVQIVEHWKTGGSLFWLFVALALLSLALCSAHIFQSHIMTGKLARRLRALEREINEIAGQRLLCWETDSGWGGNLYPVRRSSNKDQSEIV